MNNAVVGLSFTWHQQYLCVYPASGEENSESIFFQMCKKVQKAIGYWEKQESRQAEHSSFHIFFPFPKCSGDFTSSEYTR